MTIQELEEQVKVLQEKIEKMKAAEKKQKSSRWKPNFNEKYWMINDCGEVVSYTWSNELRDIWRYDNAPTFKTEAECEQYKKFREDVKTHSYEFSKKEWNNRDVEKYNILYVPFENDKLDIWISYFQRRFNTVYFKTKEDAQYIIDTYPEELKKWRV